MHCSNWRDNGGMDQLDAMRMFVRVAELESFTRSAEQLGVPKATLSATIRRLEEQMGTRLLQRTTRRVQLTPDGKLCYARCQDLLADMEEFNALFRQQGQLSGQLRVDMPSRMARHLVIPALPAWLAAPGRAVSSICRGMALAPCWR